MISQSLAFKQFVISKQTTIWLGETLSEETPSPEENTKPESKRPPVRGFNPLVNYLFYAIAILVAYVLYWAMGYPAVIAMMMFFVFRLTRDTIHVNKTYEYKFAGQAAIVNLIYSMTFFVILVVNGFAITQQLAPIILPDFIDLTSWTPLFIMGGVFGMANIKRMWGPLPKFQF